MDANQTKIIIVQQGLNELEIERQFVQRDGKLNLLLKYLVLVHKF